MHLLVERVSNSFQEISAELLKFPENCKEIEFVLYHGKSLKRSCELGVKYVNSAILTNPKIGKGHGPINHLNSIELKKIYK